MASPFFVLRTTQHDCQIGREVRTTDEVARVQPGGYVYARGRNLVEWVRRQGFEVIIDPTNQFYDLQGRPVNEPGMTVREASLALKIPVPAVTSMARSGKFDIYQMPGSPDIVLRSEQVKAVAARRAVDKKAATKKTVAKKEEKK